MLRVIGILLLLIIGGVSAIAALAAVAFLGYILMWVALIVVSGYVLLRVVDAILQIARPTPQKTE